MHSIYRVASDPGGLDQIGCFNRAQGFEFDHVGAIFGRDLVYDPATGGWRARKEYCADPMVRRTHDEKFLRLVKQVYRALLMRSLRGCYI